MVILLVIPYNVVTRYATMVCIRASGTKENASLAMPLCMYDKTAKMMMGTLPTQQKMHLH
jgi:hypothetical protein